MDFVKNGGSFLNGKIREILADPARPRTLTVSGNYEIEETILLPADFTLILEDCHLRMAPGTFCNLLRNAGAGTSSADRPDGLEKCVPVHPREAALSFIICAKPSMEPPTYSASAFAVSFADSSISVYSASRTDIISPSDRPTLEAFSSSSYTMGEQVITASGSAFSKVRRHVMIFVIEAGYSCRSQFLE